MKKELVVLLIIFMVVIISGLLYIIKNNLFSWAVEDKDNVKFHDEYITLVDGTIITGDFDKFLINDSSVTIRYFDHPELHEYTAWFVGKNIVDEIINSVTVTIRFFDADNILLSEHTVERKYLPPDEEWIGFATRPLWKYEYNPDGSSSHLISDHVSYHIIVSRTTL